jgi:hypothetical protein
MKHLKVLTLGVIFAGTLSSYAQNFLLNPSFEQPLIGGGFTASFEAGDIIGVGWVVDSTVSGTLVFGSGAPRTPTDGNQYLYVSNGGNHAVVHQDVQLGAGAYRLTFDLATFATAASKSAAVNIDLVDLGSSLSIAGGPQLFSRPAGSEFAAQSLDFLVPHAGDYRLVLETLDGFASTVDNFSLTLVSPTPVPETEAYAAIAGAAVLGFAVLRRFRKS